MRSEVAALLGAFSTHILGITTLPSSSCRAVNSQGRSLRPEAVVLRTTVLEPKRNPRNFPRKA